MNILFDNHNFFWTIEIRVDPINLLFKESLGGVYKIFKDFL